MKKIFMMEITQPIGTFYIGKMLAKDIVKISTVNQRKGDSGHQRQLREKRAKEIAMYCSDPDATFPTPIILSIAKEDFTEEPCNIPGIKCFSYVETKKIAELLDGQHRVAGIAQVKDCDFELPVIVMFDLREEQKAYVFATINGNQIKVDRSLIYDLYALNEGRSPYKTCHQIAKIMNSDIGSPFYRRLKMLERRENVTETISQNIFVTKLCELISKNPQQDAILLKNGRLLEDNALLVFRKYFKDKQDEVILRILTNYFGAAATVFKKEWNIPQKYILTKTVGFSGLMAALSDLVPAGECAGDLSKEFFIQIFQNLKQRLRQENSALTSEFFPSSSQGATKLSKLILDSSSLSNFS